MPRPFAHLFLALLLVTTLVGGGCLSCEQYFMFGGAKSCCALNGHCKTKVPVKNGSGRDCKQIAFEHQKGMDLPFDLPMVAISRMELPVLRTNLFPRWYETTSVDPSPPDLLVLHSTFLI